MKVIVVRRVFVVQWWVVVHRRGLIVPMERQKRVMVVALSLSQFGKENSNMCVSGAHV
jgi:hypothetical protein